MVGYAGDNIRVAREFVKWGRRANVINVGLLLLCVYDVSGEIPTVTEAVTHAETKQNDLVHLASVLLTNSSKAKMKQS